MINVALFPARGGSKSLINNNSTAKKMEMLDGN